jgi:hypothetical protein
MATSLTTAPSWTIWLGVAVLRGHHGTLPVYRDLQPGRIWCHAHYVGNSDAGCHRKVNQDAERNFSAGHRILAKYTVS